ncbi:MAG: hypothetical protein JWP11_1342 [Frankiales bacterium]|nr:hypothetical protein [Frankiales bacterium]
MALPPILVELRASSTEFMAKMKEARTEIAKLETEGSANFDKLAKVGKAATIGVALGVAAIGIESVKMAGDFQKETNVLVTAAGESQSSLGKVRKGILDIASATGSSWQNLTEGMYQVEKAGFRGSDGLRVLKAASQGAAEENANLSTVTSAMTSVMASYHLGANKSVQVMNALKTAAGGSKATMEEFAGSLSTVLPIASAAGLDFAQVGGAIAGLTRHGTSAAEATQELANTIRNLQAPNKVAVKEMAQFGITASDLSQGLGTRGLGGTLEYLVTTIGHHLGPQGLVMLDTFKKSKAASDDMAIAMKAMSPAAQQLAKDLLTNTISVQEYSTKAQKLPLDQAVMAQQFSKLAKTAGGFSDALKSGSPLAVTMSNELKKMLGGSTGLNTALMLTGDNQAYVNEMTKKTSESLSNGSQNVEGWESTSKLLNVQLDRMKQSVERVGITIGSALIPKIQAVVGWLEQHTTVVKALAGVLGGALVIAIGAYVSKLAMATAETVAKFAIQVATWLGYEAVVDTAAVSTGSAFVAMMLSMGAWVAETVSGFATAAAGALLSFGSMIVEAAVWAASMVASAAIAMLPFLPFIALIAAVGVAAYELYRHWDEVWGFIKNTFSTAMSFIREHAQMIVGIIAVFMPPLGLLIAAIHELWIHWGDVWNGIKDVTSAVWGVVKSIFHAIVSTGLSVIQAGLHEMSKSWNTVWDAVSGVVRDAYNVIKPIFGAILTHGLRVIHADLAVLHVAWSTVWSAIRNTVEDVWDSIRPIFEKIAAAAKHITDAIGSVAGAAKSVGGGIGGAFGKVGSLLGFNDGGYVPGPVGAAQLAIVHGGEYVTSNAMQAGRQAYDGPITGGGGGVTVVHSHVYLDGKEIHSSIQTQELRYQARNGRSAFAL